MKLINNRYKINGIIYEGQPNESYIVLDLLDKEKPKYLTLYMGERDGDIIDYFIGEYSNIRKIKHKYLIESEDFQIVETINLKRTNMSIYYTVNEYINDPYLNQISRKLSLKESLKIILDLMNVIDYLHFRGVIYRYLSPSNIFISKDNKIKLKDLGTIINDVITSNYDDFTEYFIAPEVLINRESTNENVDYYSLGMIMKYLLCKDFTIDNCGYKFKLNNEQRIFLDNIIYNLTEKQGTQKNIHLRTYIYAIIEKFQLDYKYDLKSERNHIFFNTNFIGREKEVNTILNIDNSIASGIKEYNAALITGRIGSGRSHLLKEVYSLLKLLGRQVYFFKIQEDSFGTENNVSNLIEEIFKYSNLDLRKDYEKDFSEICESFKDAEEKDYAISTKDKYRLYNRITNYFLEISKSRIIYVIIDDINKGNEDFISLLNHLIFNTNNRRVFFILSTIDTALIFNQKSKEKIKSWEKSRSILSMEIKNLDKMATEKLTKSILGTPHIPEGLSNILYRESQGNLKYLDYIIKDLYNRGELYMGEEGYWEIKSRNYNNIFIPLKENHIFRSQLEALNKEEIMILKAISIFKENISQSIISKMIDLDKKIVDKILNKLIYENIIEEKISKLGYGYGIYSIELKRLVYTSLDEYEKYQLHKKASEILLDLHKENKVNIIDELVYQLMNINNKELAANLVLKEAKQQKNRFTSYAISQWELAYAIVKDTEYKEILNILDTLTEIYLLKTNLDITEYYLDNLLYYAKQENNKEYIIKAKYYKIETHIIKNQLDIADKLVKELEELSKSEDIHEGKIICELIRSKLALNRSQLEIVQKYLLKAMELSNKYKIEKYLGNIYNLLGLYNHLNGNIPLAIEHFNNSIDFYDKVGDIVEAIKPINNLGNIYYHIYGDKDRALNYFNRGYKISNKYGFVQGSIIFVNNIGEIYLNDLQYNKALPYFKEAIKTAEKTGDIRGYFISNINLGYIYLHTDKYEKVYNIYLFLKIHFKQNPVKDIEIECSYYNFLGEFYGYLGKWKEGLDYSLKAKEGCKEYSIKEYFKAQAKVLCYRYFYEGYYNRDDVRGLIKLYDDIKINNYVLKTIFRFYNISILEKDIEFANELFNKFKDICHDLDSSMLNVFEKHMRLNLSNDKEELLEIEDFFKKRNFSSLHIRFQFYYVLGMKWFHLGEYKRSIHHLLKSIDVLLQKIGAIDDEDFKRSIIESRNGDNIKYYISQGIKYEFKKEIKYISLENIKDNDFNKYFDLKNIILTLTSEEIHSIINLENKEENIKSLEELVFKIGQDWQQSLELVLYYIKYKTLAKKGYILLLDEDTNSYNVVASLSKDEDFLMNENLLIQSSRSQVGILINKGLKSMEESKYMEFLPRDAVGIMCIPVINRQDRVDIERRRQNIINNRDRCYIYLETDSYVNKFDYDSLVLLKTLSNIINLNIENHLLKIISTTDKLTGTLTRKYFDLQLENLIEKHNKYQGCFSLLMLDIDDFKDINDNYGHLKGDEVLSIIGDTIKSSIRVTDLIGRYGGEEFIIILFNTEMAEGFKIGEKIRRNVENIKIPGINRDITVSIGLSHYPDHSQFKKELVSKADQALYHAKEVLGKNHVVPWTLDMGENIANVDKYAGIYTGNTTIDNKNISAIIDIAELIKTDIDLNEKVYRFLRIITDALNAEYATLFKIGDKNLSPLTRRAKKIGWTKNPIINKSLVEKVLLSGIDEILIDWENIQSIDPITGVPNWQSVILIPLIKNKVTKGILYVTVPLKVKEFSMEDLNLGKLLSNIFTPNID